MEEAAIDSEILEHSLVVIFDIEGFSKANPPTQAVLVRNFINSLNGRLASLHQALKPTAFSTGDGAIVAVGRGIVMDNKAVTRFLAFVLDFSAELLEGGLVIRTAVNYAERDRIVPIPDEGVLAGEYLQVGDSINVATRMLSFCEPREVMFSETFLGLLRQFGLEDEVAVVPNDVFRSKHGTHLRTATWMPTEGRRSLFYDPASPRHEYKRFNSFPPIDSTTLAFFMDAGLELELRRTISTAYDAVQAIYQTKTFVSFNPVLKVLVQLRYDPDDEVLVLWRNERPGFWTQARRTEYIRYLTTNSQERGAINQSRLMVYDDLSDESTGLMDSDDIYHDLKALHAPSSFYTFPSSQLFRYEGLDVLRYGATISSKYRFAVIPVPAEAAAEMSELRPDRLGTLLKRFPDYDPVDGPMKAVITADQPYVDGLIHQLRSALRDRQAERVT